MEITLPPLLEYMGRREIWQKKLFCNFVDTFILVSLEQFIVMS